MEPEEKKQPEVQKPEDKSKTEQSDGWQFQYDDIPF